VDKEVAALLLTVVVHVLGMGALVWALVLDDENRSDWRGWFGGDDDAPPEPPAPGPGPGGDGVPLPDARPSTVRLRDSGRLSDAHRRPARRPQHAPERTPAPRRAPTADGRGSAV
jgi:hypothetical protein